MQLLVKPTTKNLNDYLEKGIKSFLFGIKDLSSFFSMEITTKELKKLTCEYKDVEIFASIDKNIFEEELPKLKSTLKELSNINIKGLFFYDAAVLNIVTEEKLNIPLIASQNFLLTNYETCNFYKEIGCKGALITTELTKEEIKEITDKSELDIYANIFGYQLMAYSKRLLVTDYFKHIKSINLKKNNMIKKEGKDYFIEENKTGTIILSDYVLDGLKYLTYYQNCKYIILNEQNINHKLFLQVIDIYQNRILNKESKNVSDIIPNTSLGFLDTKTIYKVK